MKIEEVKLGMKIKANSNVGFQADGFVRPHDIGSVIEINGTDTILVKWNSPLVECDDMSWWIEPEYIEPYVENKKGEY